MTPERIEELRKLTTVPAAEMLAQARSRGAWKKSKALGDLATAMHVLPELLDIAERFARLRAILEPLRALEAAATDAPWHHFHDEGHSCDCGQIWSKDDLLFLPHDSEGCETNEERAAERAMRKPSGKLAVAARNALPALLREIQETP